MCDLFGSGTHIRCFGATIVASGIPYHLPSKEPLPYPFARFSAIGIKSVQFSGKGPLPRKDHRRSLWQSFIAS